MAKGSSGTRNRQTARANITAGRSGIASNEIGRYRRRHDPESDKESALCTEGPAMTQEGHEGPGHSDYGDDETKPSNSGTQVDRTHRRSPEPCDAPSSLVIRVMLRSPTYPRETPQRSVLLSRMRSGRPRGAAVRPDTTSGSTQARTTGCLHPRRFRRDDLFMSIGVLVAMLVLGTGLLANGYAARDRFWLIFGVALLTFTGLMLGHEGLRW